MTEPESGEINDLLDAIDTRLRQRPLSEPVRDLSHLSAALRRRVEEPARRRHITTLRRTTVPNVKDDHAPPQDR